MDKRKKDEFKRTEDLKKEYDLKINTLVDENKTNINELHKSKGLI